MTTFGAVVIGRNEGDRLKRCLDSVRSSPNRVVYVDSGSADDSVAVARACAVIVVELDLHTPFTAARARNEGFQKLIQMQPALDYVFFVDGDCEVVPGWLEKSKQFLDQHGDVAVVSGLRRERFPEKSIYNLLIDIEWREYLFGDVKICGGDALIRISAFHQVKGLPGRTDLRRRAGDVRSSTPGRLAHLAWQRRRTPLDAASSGLLRAATQIES